MSATLVSTDAATDEQGDIEQSPEPTGIQSFLVTFIIRRFDPEVDSEPRWVDYDV
tara:strand:+ start:180 stop:344 length:165 start_codon:yes stop_codon:yes gene_type:complete